MIQIHCVSASDLCLPTLPNEGLSAHQIQIVTLQMEPSVKVTSIMLLLLWFSAQLQASGWFLWGIFQVLRPQLFSKSAHFGLFPNFLASWLLGFHDFWFVMIHFKGFWVKLWTLIGFSVSRCTKSWKNHVLLLVLSFSVFENFQNLNSWHSRYTKT